MCPSAGYLLISPHLSFPTTPEADILNPISEITVNKSSHNNNSCSHLILNHCIMFYPNCLILTHATTLPGGSIIIHMSQQTEAPRGEVTRQSHTAGRTKPEFKLGLSDPMFSPPPFCLPCIHSTSSTHAVLSTYNVTDAGVGREE